MEPTPNRNEDRVDTTELKIRLAKFLCPSDADDEEDGHRRWRAYWSAFADYVVGECGRAALDAVARRCLDDAGSRFLLWNSFIH